MDIPDDSVACPVCKTDLAPLQRIRQLHLAEFNEAVRLADQGAIDEALKHAAAASALCPAFVPVLILLGNLFWAKGLLREAMSHWDEARCLEPANEEVAQALELARRTFRRQFLNRTVVWSTAAILVAAAGFLAVRMSQNTAGTPSATERHEALQQVTPTPAAAPAVIAVDNRDLPRYSNAEYESLVASNRQLQVELRAATEDTAGILSAARKILKREEEGLSRTLPRHSDAEYESLAVSNRQLQAALDEAEIKQEP